MANTTQNTSYSSRQKLTAKEKARLANVVPSQKAKDQSYGIPNAKSLSKVLKVLIEQQQTKLNTPVLPSYNAAITSSFTPPEDDPSTRFAQLPPVAFDAGANIAPSSFPGLQQSMSQFQTGRQEGPMDIAPANVGLGWVSPTDAAQVRQVPSSNVDNLGNPISQASGAYYLTDPSQPGGLVHAIRNSSQAEQIKAKVLQGRDPSLYQLDHALPLSMGGVDDISNMQLLTNQEHEKKTKIQSVPYTLWRASRDNPEELKKFGVDPIQLGEAQLALTDWKNYSDTDLSTPDDTGVVSIEQAANAWKSWKTYKQPSFFDTLKQVPKEMGAAGKIVGDWVAKKIESLPILGQQRIATPFLTEAARGLGTELTFGYGKLGSTDWEEAAKASDAPYWKSQYAKENKVAGQVGNAVGSTLGFLASFIVTGGIVKAVTKVGYVTKLGKASEFTEFNRLGRLTKGVGEAAAKGPIGISTIAAGLKQKAFAKFGSSSVGKIAASNTLKAAKAAVEAVKTPGPTARIFEAAPWAWTTAQTAKVPMIGEAFGDTMRALKWNAQMENIGLMVVHGLLHQQDDRSLGATMNRVMWDSLNGAAFGMDAHNLPGYMKVFGKGAVMASMEQGFNMTDESSEGDVMGILQNALMLTALHGLGHTKEIRTREKGVEVVNKYIKQAKIAQVGEKPSFTETEKGIIQKSPFVQEAMKTVQSERQANLQNDLIARIDDRMKYSAAVNLHAVSPEAFPNPGKFETFKPNEYYAGKDLSSEALVKLRNEGTKKWKETAETNVDKNGNPIWSEQDLALVTRQLDTSLRFLESTRKTPAEADKMLLQDLQSWSVLLQRMLNNGQSTADPSLRLTANEAKNIFFEDVATPMSRSMDPSIVPSDSPTGVFQTTGGDWSMSERQWQLLQEAKVNGTRGTRALLVRSPSQGTKETLRRSQYTAEERATKDIESNPDAVISVYVPYKESNGNVSWTKVGMMPSKKVLDRMNEKTGEIVGSLGTKEDLWKNYEGEQMNLDKDTIARLMDEKNVGAIVGDIREMGAEGTKRWFKIAVTEDGLARTQEFFEGTKNGAEVHSPMELMARARSIAGPEDSVRFVDTLKKKMDIEPSYEMLDKVFNNPEEYSEAFITRIKGSEEVFTFFTNVARGKSADEIVSTITKRYGEIISPERAEELVSKGENLSIRDLLSVIEEGVSNGTANGQAVVDQTRIVSGILRTSEFVQSPLLGHFLDLPIIGSKKAIREAPVEAKMDSESVQKPEVVSQILKAPQEALQGKIEHNPVVVDGQSAPETPKIASEGVQTPEMVQTPVPEQRPLVEAPRTLQTAPEPEIVPIEAPKPVGQVKTQLLEAKAKENIPESLPPEVRDQLSAIKEGTNVKYIPEKGEPEIILRGEEAFVETPTEKKAGESLGTKLVREPSSDEKVQLSDEMATNRPVETQDISLTSPSDARTLKDGKLELSTIIFSSKQKELITKRNELRQEFFTKNGKKELTEEQRDQLNGFGKMITSLEERKNGFSRENIQKRLVQLREKNNGDSHKAMDELIESMESGNRDFSEKYDIEIPQLFSNEATKNDFKVLLRRLIDAKPREVIQVKNGKIQEDFESSSVKSKSPTDRFIEDFSANHPEVGKIELKRYETDGVVESKADDAYEAVLDIVNKGRAEKDQYVVLGIAGNNVKNIILVKYNDKLANLYTGEGAEKMTPSERFRVSFYQNVIGLDQKTASNFGKLNKRTSILNFSEPRLDLRDEKGLEIQMPLFIMPGRKLGELGLVDERLLQLPTESGKRSKVLDGINGKDIMDGANFIPEEGFKLVLKAMNSDPSLGYIKSNLVWNTGSGTAIIKGQFYPMPKHMQRSFERKIGKPLDKFSIIGSTENVKIGLGLLEDMGDGLVGAMTPSSSWHAKVVPKKAVTQPKASASIYSRAPYDPIVNKAFIDRYAEPAKDYKELLSNIGEARKRGEPIRDIIREANTKFKEKYGIDLVGEIDSADWEKMNQLLSRSDTPDMFIEKKLEENVAKAFQTKILSGRFLGGASYDYVQPDLASKGALKISDVANHHSKEELGHFTHIAELITSSKSKEIKDKVGTLTTHFNELFGDSVLSGKDARYLLDDNADVYRIVDILEDGNRANRLNDYGKTFLKEQVKNLYLKPDEIMLARSDWEKLGKPTSIVSVRQPITRLTALAKAKVVLAEDYGMDVKKGTVITSAYDGYVRKEFDFDGDAYEIFPIYGKGHKLAGKGIPEEFADYIESRRTEDRDIVLDPLTKFGEGEGEKPIDMTDEGVHYTVNAAIHSGKGIGQAQGVGRILAQVKDSKLPLTSGMKEDPRFVGQIAQETVDGVTYGDFERRMRETGLDDANQILISHLFNTKSPKEIAKISKELREFQTAFQLVDEEKNALDSTSDLVSTIQKVFDLNDKINAADGKLTPFFDVLDQFRGLKPIERTDRGVQNAADASAMKEVKDAFIQEKGEDFFKITSGTPESHVVKMAANINTSRQARRKAYSVVMNRERQRAQEKGEEFNEKEFWKNYNIETGKLSGESEKILDTVFNGYLTSGGGLTDDQLLRIGYHLATRPDMNRNYSSYEGLKKDEDVYRYMGILTKIEPIVEKYFGAINSYIKNKSSSPKTEG